jgi:hypothetical protein
MEGKKTSGFKRFIRTFVILALVILVGIIYWFGFNTYGTGERTGIVIKFTNKGNVFKTNEGEMWLSCRQMTNPDKFYFSVTSDSIANLIRELQDGCVQLNYVQYRMILPWRGDSKYIVTGVRKITDGTH